MDELGPQQAAEGPAPTAGPSSISQGTLERLRARRAGTLTPGPGDPVSENSTIVKLRERREAQAAAAAEAARLKAAAENQPGFFRKNLDRLQNALNNVTATITHGVQQDIHRDDFTPEGEPPPQVVPESYQALPSMAPAPLPEALQPSLPVQMGVTPEEQVAIAAEQARVAQMQEGQARLATEVPHATGRMDFEGPRLGGDQPFAPGSLIEKAEVLEQAGITPEQFQTIPGLPGSVTEALPESVPGMGAQFDALKRQFDEETAGMNADQVSNYMLGALVRQAPVAAIETISNMVEGAVRIGEIMGADAGAALLHVRTGEHADPERGQQAADAVAALTDKILEIYPWTQPESAAEMAAAGVERMMGEMYTFMRAGRSFAARRGVDIAKLKGVSGAAQAVKYYGPLDAAIGAANPENSSLGALEPLIGDIPFFNAQNPVHRAAFEVVTGATADVIFGVIGDTFRFARQNYMDKITAARFEEAAIIDAEREFLNEVASALTEGGHSQEKVREVMLALPPGKQEPIRRLLGPGVPLEDLPPGTPRLDVETVEVGRPPRTIGEEPIPPRQLVDEQGQTLLDVREEVPTALEVAEAGAERLSMKDRMLERLRARRRGESLEEGELPTQAQAAYRRSGETLEEEGVLRQREREELEAQQDLERRTAGPTKVESERIRLQRDLRGRAVSMKDFRSGYSLVDGAEGDVLKELAVSDAQPTFIRILAQQKLEGREMFTPEYLHSVKAYDDFHRGDGLENRRRSLGAATTSEGPVPPTSEPLRAAADDLVSETGDLDTRVAANLASEQGQAAVEAGRVLDDTADLYEALARGNPVYEAFKSDPVRGLIFAAGAGAATLAAESEGADSEKLAMLGIFGISGATPRAIRRTAIKGLGTQAAAHIAEGVSKAEWASQMLRRYGDDFTEEIADEAWVEGEKVLGKLRERSSGLVEKLVDIDDVEAIRGMLETGLTPREVFVNKLTNRVVPRGEGLFGPDAGARDILKFIVKPRTWYKGSLRKLTKFFGNERDADLFLRMYSTLSPQREAATSNITLAIQAFNRYKMAQSAGDLLDAEGVVRSDLFKGIGNSFQTQELADAVAGFPTTTVKRSDFTAGFRQGAKLPRAVQPEAPRVPDEVSPGSRQALEEHPPTKAAEREMDELLERYPNLDRDRAFQYLADGHNPGERTRISKREVEELFETLVRDRASGRNLQGANDLQTRLQTPEVRPPATTPPAPGRVVSDVWLGRLFGLADLAGAPVFRFGGARKNDVVAELIAAGWDRQEARKFVFAKVDGDDAVLPKKYRSSKQTLPQRSAANKYIQDRKGGLTAEEYEFISERVRIIASSYGLDSYEAQSALWVAAKLAVEGADTDIRALHQILETDPRFRRGMYDPERGFVVPDLDEARDVARAVDEGPIPSEEFAELREMGFLDSGDPAGNLPIGRGKAARTFMHPAIKIGKDIIEAPRRGTKRAMHVQAVDRASQRGIDLATGVDGFTGPSGSFFERKAAMEALQKIGLASAVMYSMQSGTFGEGGESNAENIMMAMGLSGLPSGARKRIAKILVDGLKDFPGEKARIAGRTALGAGTGAAISAIVTPEEGRTGVLTGAGIGAALGAGTGYLTRARLKPSRFGEGVKGVGSRSLPETPTDAFRQARAATLDDIEPARKLVMEAERVTGAPVEAINDVEAALRASRAWAPYAEIIMRDGVMAPGESVPRTRRGLRQVYQDVGERIGDLRDYALARRAKELDGRNKQIPEELENYDEILAQFEGDEAITSAFDDIQENFQELLKVAEEVGLIEPGGAARIGSKNQNYVPFWRDIRMEGAAMQGPFKQLIRQIKGSKFAVEDPIVTMIQAQAKFAEAIFRQQSANALWRFGAEYPDASLISRVTDKAHARPSDMPRLTGGADDAMFENLPRNVFDVDGADVHGRQLRIYEQGKAVTFKVNDDLLWDAYVQTPESAAMAVRVGAIASKILREFVTTEPTFAFTNFLRDVGTGVITSKTLGNPATRWPKAFKDALQGISVALVAREGSVYNRAAEGALVGGTLGYIGGTEDKSAAGLVGATIGGLGAGVGARGLAGRAAKRAGAESPEALYRAWVTSGGAQGVVEGFRTRRETMRGIVKDATRRQTVPVAHPIRVLQDLNRAVEEGNRLAEWIRLMERSGMDRTHPELMRDAMVTRDLTTDFLRKGGAKTIQAVSMLKAFWNPRVQGYDRLARVFTEAGRGTGPANKQAAAAAAASTVAAITIPSLMLSYVNNKYHREEMLRDTTSFDRTYFWLIKNPLGDGFIRIPKPFEMGVLFGSLPERIFEQQVFGDDERLEPLTEGGLEEVLTAFGSDLTETISPVPTILDPWAENMTNKDFAGNPVVNPYELLQNKEPELMDREKASEIGKFIADQLDVPAPQVDNVLTGYTGRVGEEALRLGDQILATMGESETGEPVAQRPSDSFLGNRFLSDTPRRTTATTTRFYEEFREAEKVRNTLKDTEGDVATAEWEKTTEEGVRYTELKKVGKEILDMRNMQKQVRDATTKGDVPWYPEARADEPLTGEEKRIIIDRISRLVDELAFEAVTGEEPEPLAPTEITF